MNQPTKIEQAIAEAEGRAQVLLAHAMMLRGTITSVEQYCAEVAPLIRAVLQREMFIKSTDWRDEREAVSILMGADRRRSLTSAEG